MANIIHIFVKEYIFIYVCMCVYIVKYKVSIRKKGLGLQNIVMLIICLL